MPEAVEGCIREVCVLGDGCKSPSLFHYITALSLVNFLRERKNSRFYIQSEIFASIHCNRYLDKLAQLTWVCR
jgi:hypothetical protein